MLDFGRVFMANPSTLHIKRSHYAPKTTSWKEVLFFFLVRKYNIIASSATYVCTDEAQNPIVIVVLNP